MPPTVQAYAKIVGLGWHFYMTKPKIILGRGGRGVDCDIELSTESAVSRQHFSIRFAPEHEALEIENLSKNGILVNGDFLTRFSQPLLIRAQAEIAFGKAEDMRVTVLLPVAYQAVEKKKRNTPFVPLLDWIGDALVTHGSLRVDELVAVLQRVHPSEIVPMGHDRLVNSIRHVIMQHDHIFHIVDPIPDLATTTVGRQGVDTATTQGVAFGVRPEARSRFYQYAQTRYSSINAAPASDGRAAAPQTLEVATSVEAASRDH